MVGYHESTNEKNIWTILFNKIYEVKEQRDRLRMTQ